MASDSSPANEGADGPITVSTITATTTVACTALRSEEARTAHSNAASGGMTNKRHLLDQRDGLASSAPIAFPHRIRCKSTSCDRLFPLRKYCSICRCPQHPCAPRPNSPPMTPSCYSVLGQAGKQVVQSLKRGNIGHAINPFLPEMALKRGHDLAGFATKSATDFQVITI